MNNEIYMRREKCGVVKGGDSHQDLKEEAEIKWYRSEVCSMIGREECAVLLIKFTKRQ